jgi:hypothetical protein
MVFSDTQLFNKLFMKKLFTVLVLFISIIIIACNSTKVLTSWKAPAASNLQSYKKIIIVALSGDKYNDMRQTMENNLVQEMKARGVNAVSSFELYGPKSFKGMEEKEVVEKFTRENADAAITVVLLDRKKEKYYTPGTVSYYPGYYSRFWGYYNTMYDRVYTPGYYTTTIDYFLETNLYTLSNDALQYSVQTRTSDPSDAQSMAGEVSKAVVKDMAKKGIL